MPHRKHQITQSTFPRTWLFLQQHLGGSRDKSLLALRHWDEKSDVLEIGCSAGNISGTFRDREGVRITGIDIDGVAIALARHRFRSDPQYKFLHESVESHAESGASYGYILVGGMLHHVDDDVALSILMATRKLLRRSGKIVVYEPEALKDSDPFISRLFYRAEQGSFLRSHEGYKELLLRAGMVISGEERHQVRPGFPGLPAVACFSLFVSAWDDTSPDRPAAAESLVSAQNAQD